jgi:hypothetical protein
MEPIEILDIKNINRTLTDFELKWLDLLKEIKLFDIDELNKSWAYPTMIHMAHSIVHLNDKIMEIQKKLEEIKFQRIRISQGRRNE